jgi:hypothetical protein
MPRKKRNVKKHFAMRKQPENRPRRSKKLLNDISVLTNVIRDLCYRYGLAMARFEFKGKSPKPSIDEFRERIVHHTALMETSFTNKLPTPIERPLKQARTMLSTRLKLDMEKVRNGANAEVETVYDSL